MCRSFTSTVVIPLEPQLRCSDGRRQQSQRAEVRGSIRAAYCTATLSVLAKRRLMRTYSSTMPVINTNVTEITVV